MPPITLTTDFGTRDYYVAAMKGVILGIAPHATIVDITHEIEPQNVAQAAFILRHTWASYPPGTVHVAVVDPGVGSQRGILAGRYAAQVVIAPDNGLITLVHRELPLEALHLVTNSEFFRQPVSHTFHGRDIIAPVAARVATGVRLERLGPAAGGVEMLQLADVKPLTPRGLRGVVLFADRFGNLVTNISQAHLAELIRQHPDVAVYIDERQIGFIRRTYSDVSPGQPLALVGSCGQLEIAVNGGRADEFFGRGPEFVIEVR